MEPNLIPASEMKKLFTDTTDQVWNARRHKGTGPQYVKLGRKVYYRAEDVEAWVNANMYERPDRPIRGDVNA